jgi:sulfane dehydrogenase subunit SoxC
MNEHASQFGDSGQISLEELQLATRNHGMPLEALAQAITPVGLHYLLIHYDIAFLDPQAWRLDLSGRFDRPLELGLDDLRARPRASVIVTMECAGNGRATFDPRVLSQPWLHEAVGTAEWTGTPLRLLLDEAGVADDAVDVVFSGADQGVEGGEEQTYARALSIMDACQPEVLLAYEMNGAPLLPQHGAPVRLVCPGWYGMANVKWLTRIEAIDRPFAGYQQLQAYRVREIGVIVLDGRAWSGFAPIVAVEVSIDGGQSWMDAEVDDARLGQWAWQQWRFRWQPDAPGDYVLCCRARDAAGNDHRSLPEWNLGGYASRKPHPVHVTVTARRTSR